MVGTVILTDLVTRKILPNIRKYDKYSKYGPGGLRLNPDSDPTIWQVK